MFEILGNLPYLIWSSTYSCIWCCIILPCYITLYYPTWTIFLFIWPYTIMPSHITVHFFYFWFWGWFPLWFPTLFLAFVFICCDWFLLRVKHQLEMETNNTHWNWGFIALDKTVCFFFNQKVLVFFIFLNENIYCGYSLEAPATKLWWNSTIAILVPTLHYMYMYLCKTNKNNMYMYQYLELGVNF